MFKIQFKFQKYYDCKMYCEIINTNDTNDSIVTLWNIEENKYIDIYTLGKPTKVYTKYFL